ncbi:Fur family transcriptional regulator [Solemya velesiana gill symbiont]|uniref:Fur family transcriptional regulator n=1 Tax=Solemya velesiana gill symbiont TaxID=1918948 RepID=A0A1T2KS71_9GAMM|nr:Fur family transcriptional regulator [Solemya velesiana gill symbiont]OOZ35719.1 Fur family transcriptional regulator [Solemya velesiana gill symbiont]
MASKKEKDLFPAANHDHKACIKTALNEAERYCRENGLRLTELRRRVLELVWASHRPVGAYDLLEKISSNNRKAAPPTVYRSLDFLMEHGLIHRIASLNAYVGCSHLDHHHAPRFFICDQCGEAAELDDPVIDDAIARDAKRLGFRVERQTLEISGVCATCEHGSTG